MISNIIIIIISLIIIIGILYHERDQRRENQNSQYRNFSKQQQDTLLKLDQKIQERQKMISNEEAHLASLRQICDTYELETKRRIDNNAEIYKNKAMQFVKNIVSQRQEKEELVAKRKTDEALAQFADQERMAQEELQNLMDEIESERRKREAINEDLRRQRELQEKKDYYRVCLSEEAIADIEILTNIRKNLKKPEFIDKIIYDNYVSKPVLEMIKRVLQNTTYSGIYKITCLPTKEIYVGKSTDIKNRWQQHCKTAFNCGTIASSLLHTKMRQYGIENFTFELLEKVPKDKLTEREKFYINFYQTKEVGLNERNG